uniref:HNH endonuclease n=1 Tax=Aggregatibacter kilianii TaxID=2025884 RepID=UPI00248EB693
SFKHSNLNERFSRYLVQPQKQFNAEQISAIKAGKEKIPDYTWHHHQDTGRMQLIETRIHTQTGHIGGEGINAGK